MTSHPTIVRNVPHQDLLNDLHTFVSNVNRLDKCNLVEVTKTALSLLKSLPATRNAVFEYFSKVFTSASLKYIEGIENEIKTGKVPIPSETDEAVASEIHSVLITLINDFPIAWAPIISTWSLELLGEISTKYSGRAHINLGVLNETLQLWIGCRATRTLVDINTKCLSSLMYSDTETCINALLDTSVKHSPNFDWVVAHVGSCFPNTVITRVLSCGLKDFCKNKSYEQGYDSAKLKSVVGILGHLAGSHSPEIRAAILEIFQWSLQQSSEDNDQTKLQKKATVPFILQLSFFSNSLLSSICSDLKEIFNIGVIENLYRFIDDWCKYFGSAEALENLVTALVLKCNTGGMQIIKLLIGCILTENMSCNDTIKHVIQEKCKEMLQNILVEMDESLRTRNELNIINTLNEEIDRIHEMILSSNDIELLTAGQLIVFLGYNDPSVLIKSVIFLLQNATTDNHLAIVIKILTSELIDKTKQPYAEKGGHFAVALEQIISKDIQKFLTSNEESVDLSQMWDNLLTLLRWEYSSRVTVLHSQIISRGIFSNLETITSVFGSEMTHMHVIADILDTLEIPSHNTAYTPSLEVILNLTQSTVNYFFACCTDEGTALKIKGFKKACSILKRLCNYSKVARVLALRELLERALFRSENILFGAKSNLHDVNENLDKFLLKQNKKISKTIPLTKHSSVFNGGVIGGGKRKMVLTDELPPDSVAANTCELMFILKACCSLPDDVEIKYCDLSLDSVTLVSLLLVQFVSPDVMYNGLPWPEEEFAKVTIERDLLITKLFNTIPLLWDLLNFVAVYRPALCYCSVLIRALIATLIHQWKSMGELNKSTGTQQYNALIDTTIKVIDTMALGQLLPPPLSNIRDVLSELKCFEIVAILRDCIWCYIRDHVPSPALFNEDTNGIHWRDPIVARPSEIYTNSLKIIMQRNIKSLGHIYSQMFINIPKQE